MRGARCAGILSLVSESIRTYKTKPFGLPFPVADTECGPVLKWERECLTVSFTTLMKDPVELIFEDVPHFEWVAEGVLDPRSHPDDGAVRVVDSPLIKRFVEIGTLTRKEAAHCTHAVIGFNELGTYLVIVFRMMKQR